jgi:predicted DNA-binding transcriptional regulator AlpA
MKTESERLLTTNDVADEFGIAAQTLANWRWQGTGPCFIKTTPGRGGRVKYRRSDLEAWLDQRTVSTAPI